LPLSLGGDTLPNPPPDADAQSTTVGIVASGEGDHPGGIPCGACVTCACDAAPRVDEDGLCLGCGGVPVAVAILWGEPHVGPAAELADDDRSEIARLIEEERRFWAEGRATMLPPEADERAGWPTAKGWAAKLTSHEYVRHGALDETPWRLRLEDDREGTGFLTISEETITSRRPTARTMAVITALDLTEDEALWLRDVLTEALRQEPREETL
jgi:hypothetical protein